MYNCLSLILFFFFNDTATTEIYTLSLHDALPISRVIVPPLGNEFNGMIKNTSLLAFIGVYEMFFDAEIHYSTTFQPVEYFLAVAFWYLVLTTIWSAIQARIERRLNRAEQTEETGVKERVRRLQW